MLKHYTERIGLERYAKFDMADVRNRIRRHQRVRGEYLTGARIYCLKVRDYDSAELLLELLDSKQEQLKALRTKIA